MTSGGLKWRMNATDTPNGWCLKRSVSYPGGAGSQSKPCLEQTTGAPATVIYLLACRTGDIVLAARAEDVNTEIIVRSGKRSQVLEQRGQGHFTLDATRFTGRKVRIEATTTSGDRYSGSIAVPEKCLKPRKSGLRQKTGFLVLS